MAALHCMCKIQKVSKSLWCLAVLSLRTKVKEGTIWFCSWDLTDRVYQERAIVMWNTGWSFCRILLFPRRFGVWLSSNFLGFSFQKAVRACSVTTQSCVTLWGPVDCSPPGSSVHGIFQAKELEWVAISFQGIFWPRDLNLHLLLWWELPWWLRW